MSPAAPPLLLAPGRQVHHRRRPGRAHRPVPCPALTLILSPSQRQSGETFRKIKDTYNALGRPAGAVVENARRWTAARHLAQPSG